MYAWSSWHTLVPLLLGVAGIVGFSYYEWRLSSKAFDSDGNVLPGDKVEPIIRFSVFNNWTMRITYLGTIIHGIVLWGLLYYVRIPAPSATVIANAMNSYLSTTKQSKATRQSSQESPSSQKPVS
jgi:hypothetical protein